MEGTIPPGVFEFKIQHAKSDHFFWTLHDQRHPADPVAQSRTFASKQSCLENISRLQGHAGAASVLDMTT